MRILPPITWRRTPNVWGGVGRGGATPRHKYGTVVKNEGPASLQALEFLVAGGCNRTRLQVRTTPRLGDDGVTNR
jgi:hypothetical protein